MDSFPCTQCGLCCRLVGHILANKSTLSDPVLRFLAEQFPYSADETGACEKLQDNSCSVYESRPLLCDIDKVAELKGVDVEEYRRLNAKICNMLIRMYGLDDSFLIKAYDQAN